MAAILLLLSALLAATAATHGAEVGAPRKHLCLVSDKHVHINIGIERRDAELRETSAKIFRTWIRELGILWKGHTLRLQALSGVPRNNAAGLLGAADLDGTPMWVPSRPGNSFVSGSMTLTYLGSVKSGPATVQKYSVRIGSDLDLTFTLRAAQEQLRTAVDAGVHFGLAFNRVAVTAGVQGVLGRSHQTEQGQQSGAPVHLNLDQLLSGGEGEPLGAEPLEDFMASSALEADCKASGFVREAAATAWEDVVF